MAKDPRKNVSQFKTGGGGLNEFEFHQHQQELAEQHNVGESHLIPGTPPAEDRVQEVTRKAHELVMKRAAAKSGSKAAAEKTNPTSKKSAASKKKPAKKSKATKKSAATKKKPATKSTKKATRKK